MVRYVIVRCLARAGSGDVQYDARAAEDPWPGSEEAVLDWYSMYSSDYQRLIQVVCDSDMSWRVIADRLWVDHPHSAAYSPDEMHAIQTPDTALAAVDVARAYAWPQEYAEYARVQDGPDKRLARALGHRTE